MTWGSEKPPRVGRWACCGAAMVLAAVGCLSRDDAGAGEAPTLATVQSRIFTPKCGLSGCHGGASPMLGMSLEAGKSAESIIGVKSVESMLMRVKPGDPDNSYLVAKVEGRARDVGGSGERMPLNSPPLGATEIALLRAWIVALGDQPIAPSVTSLVPATGEIGETVVVEGANFGDTQGDSQVLFGTTAVTTVGSWSAARLEVTVPAGLANGNVDVTVRVGSLTSSAKVFAVRVERHPTITAISQDTVVVGQAVTITGTDFGDVQDVSTVNFGTVAASSITMWSSTQVVAVVPARVQNANVTVTVDENASNGVPYFVVLPRLASIQESVLDRRCIACHHTGGSVPNPATDCAANALSGPLNLDEGQSHANLVGVDSCQQPGTLRVRRGWRAQSYLLTKLSQASPPMGNRCPQDGPPLSNDVLEVLATWIDLGANNN